MFLPKILCLDTNWRAEDIFGIVKRVEPDDSMIHIFATLYRNKLFQCLFALSMISVIVSCDAGFGRSSNADLARLSVTDITLDPSFDKDDTEYTSRVAQNISTVTFNATTDDENATMTLAGQSLVNDIDRTITLSIGRNEVELVVTAENESTKTYEFVITRLEETSDNAFLDALDVEYASLDQIFSAASFDYTSNVNFLVNSTRVTLTRSNELARAVLNAQPESPLNDGVPSENIALSVDTANTLEVEVTSGDDSTVNTYSVVINRESEDGLATAHYLKASNSDEGDNFGFVSALGGDMLVVGAPGEQSNSENSESNNGAENAGAAYVFQNTGGVWAQSDYLKASPTISAGDLFGYSIAVDGDTLAIGAPGSNSDAGRVYLFTLSGSDWDFDQSISASDTVQGQEFGFSVGLSGDYLIVGAPGVGAESGAIYIFEEDGNDWEEREIRTLEVSPNDARFGESLAFNSGQENLEFVAAAPGLDAGEGAVFTLEKDDDDIWSQSAPLKASNTDLGDNFGKSLSVQNNILVVGAPGEDSNANGVDGDTSNNEVEGAGAAYIYIRDNQNEDWGDEVYLKATQDSDMAFGTAVALSSGMVAVGAPLEDSDATNINGDDDNSSEVDSGAVYIFALENNNWEFEVYAKSSNTDGGDLFGEALVFYGENLVVGARTEDSGTNGIDSTPDEDATDAGAVYIVR